MAKIYHPHGNATVVSSDHIESLQKLLRRTGYNLRPMDGYFDVFEIVMNQTAEDGFVLNTGSLRDRASLKLGAKNNRQNARIRTEQALEQAERARALRPVVIDRPTLDRFYDNMRAFDEVIGIYTPGQRVPVYDYEVRESEHCVVLFYPSTILDREEFVYKGVYTGLMTSIMGYTTPLAIRMPKLGGYTALTPNGHPHAYTSGNLCLGARNHFPEGDPITTIPMFREYISGHTKNDYANGSWCYDSRAWWLQYGDAFFAEIPEPKLVHAADGQQRHTTEITPLDRQVMRDWGERNEGLDMRGWLITDEPPVVSVQTRYFRPGIMTCGCGNPGEFQRILTVGDREINTGYAACRCCIALVQEGQLWEDFRPLHSPPPNLRRNEIYELRARQGEPAFQCSVPVCGVVGCADHPVPRREAAAVYLVQTTDRRMFPVCYNHRHAAIQQLPAW